MAESWSDFYVTIGGAAAALTGLLFVAVSLRPREIREGPLTIGRARSAFYAFATVVFVALLSLDEGFEVGRAVVYHLGLLLILAGGILRLLRGVRQANELVLAAGVLVLLGIAISNSWQLVLTHDG